MVTFKNKKILSTINIFGGRSRIQGADREYLELKIPEDEASYEELKEIFLDKDSLSELTIVEALPPEEPDGEARIAQYLHLNYSIPVSLSLEPFEDGMVYIMKLAQKSELELDIEAHAKLIDDTQLALMELASMM